MSAKMAPSRSAQRWKCRRRTCGYEFPRTTPRGTPAAKHALARLLYSMGRASYGIIARVLQGSRTTGYRWVRHHAAQLPEPISPLAITEIEFDEMWHYIGSKKTWAGSGTLWTVIHGELSPGSSVVVLLPPSVASLRGEKERGGCTIPMTGRPLVPFCLTRSM